MRQMIMCRAFLSLDACPQVHMRIAVLFWMCITLAQLPNIRCEGLSTTVRYCSVLTSPDTPGLDTRIQAYEPGLMYGCSL